MAIDLVKARAFVRSIDLSGIPHRGPALGAAPVGAPFDKAENQAQLVGSTLLSFAQGVDAGIRGAVSDSALLAQLVANKQASAESDPMAWFAAYSGVLQNIGWIVEESGWADYSADGDALDVNQKIIEVLAVALGPAPAAMAIITAAIAALSGMESDSPWITIFSREAQKARLARFQVGLVDRDQNGDAAVVLLACLIEAQSNITQVLFFKFKEAQARFLANNAKASLDRTALTELAPTIREKVRAWQVDYVSTVLNIEP